VNVVGTRYWEQEIEAPAARWEARKGKTDFLPASFASAAGEPHVRDSVPPVLRNGRHKDTVVVCVLAPVGETETAIRKVYSTFRNDLTRMRGWLKLLKVTEIAMESTGVYWRPVWNVLEEQGFRGLAASPVSRKWPGDQRTQGRLSVPIP